MLLGRSTALHEPFGRRETELLVEPVGVGGVEKPAVVRVRAAFDRLADELLAEPPAAVRVEHVDVGQVRKGHPRDERRPGKADLAAVVVEADEPRGRRVHRLLRLTRPALRPVRLLGEVPVDRVEVDPLRVVVELETARQLAPHDTRSVRRRKPPWNSYDDEMTASASRAERSESPASCASASGRDSSASIPWRPAGESGSTSSPHALQTAPPARGE